LHHFDTIKGYFSAQTQIFVHTKALYLKRRLRILILASLPFLWGSLFAASYDEPLKHYEQKKILERANETSRTKSHIYTETETMQEESNQTASNGPCVRIDTIHIEGATLIDPKTLDSVTQKYENRCLDVASITRLINEINNLYRQKGFITSRAYIKEQTLEDHILTISVMEGRVQEVTGEGVFTDWVFLGYADKPFEIRDIEARLEQLNTLPSKQVTMDVVPGDKVGYSKLHLKAKRPRFPVHGHIGVDNFGSSSMDRYQFTARLAWDDPLGINDQLTIDINTANPEDADNNTLGSGIQYGFPVGLVYLKAGYFSFEYDQVVPGLNQNYKADGESREWRLDADYKLFHTATQRGRVTFSFTHKRNDNYLEGELLDTSSSEIDIAQISYSHFYTYSDLRAFITIGYARGLDIFDVRIPEARSGTFDKFFTQWNMDCVVLPGSRLHYSLAGYVHYVSKEAITTEYISIGGPYSVRGFEETQLSGSFGGYVRNEIFIDFDLGRAHLSPYIGYDYGAVKRNALSTGGQISGACVGVRALWRALSLDLFAAKALSDSTETIVEENGDVIHRDHDPYLGFSITFQF